MLTPGDMLKDYEVIAPLRSGGMALLFLARKRGAEGFQRLVALKLVHPDLSESSRMTTLFLAEARISSQIAHPNVVRVEDLGVVDGRYFLAMEYVHGVTLAELLAVVRERRLRMNVRLCVWLVAQIAEALHAAHEARGENDKPLRIVHSDVSPQNVLISHTGHVKLIDFGIAKSHHGDDPGEPVSALLGKLGYMAPEQLTLSPLDRRTDVYALGVVLWEMLTGRNLFRRERAADERDWATRENPPLVSAFSPIGDALERAVRRAIERNPDARYSSALAFRAALLRAEPDAQQVDAPCLASFLHSLVGPELARQRASWPREVSEQLERDASCAGEPSATLALIDEDELTTAVRDEQRLFEDADNDAETRVVDWRSPDEQTITQVTLPQVPSAPPAAAWRFDPSRPSAPILACSREDVARSLSSYPPREALPSSRLPAVLRTGESFAQVVTIGSPASVARPSRFQLRSHAALFVIGALCVAVGMALGRHMQSEPVGSPASRAASSAPLRPTSPASLATERPNTLREPSKLTAEPERARHAASPTTRAKLSERAKRNRR